ncbi:MAG: hypothetical protein PHS83_01030 [Clostridia bacterium]|nr:hypothetical protein [Clostridia bacterium]MDD4145683.1 hypothetical protein [Clostridia bacterium]MDD4665191.1 hypothetical protein [Clostridia bacterium]
MVKITVKDVEKMADLAKLELSAEESLNFEQSLQVILEQGERVQGQIFMLGDKVFHQKWGEGVIVSTKGQGNYQ